ncbi:GNAT family N-acetyltransferase [Bacillaceae bacterium SIJ1]|uniref:GNAT family N-acetyltransferase n=1 Tax=Litoribacterium kuwaitense TaxID=1398745 RepID=UPI0013EA33E6|nr:GNAT family N-acetyltransferase [Litoribacterium kuwaitense]NGP45880.1 GNAT family N-acetyltransferase [Litoribacterium kuwaitense]
MLESERLLYKRYELADLPFYCKMWQHPDVVRYIGNGSPKTADEAERSLRYWALPLYEERLGLYQIIDKKTKAPMGHAGLVRQQVEGRTEIEIGYWLLPEYWGYGYAKEAASTMKAYGEAELGLSRLICLIHPEHPASIFVALKTGMHYEKTSVYNGRDVLVYATTGKKVLR